MQNNKSENYKIQKGEVLEGSALLKKQDSNSSRVKYMIQNIEYNRAFEDFFLKSDFRIINDDTVEAVVDDPKGVNRAQ